MDEDNVEVKLEPYESVYDKLSNFLVFLLDTAPYDSTTLQSFLPVHSGGFTKIVQKQRLLKIEVCGMKMSHADAKTHKHSR